MGAGIGADADLADPTGPLEDTVPAARPITVEDLMTHRSGLAYAFSVTGPISKAYAHVSLRQDQDHWLAEVAELRCCTSPASGSPTVTPPRYSASCSRGSRASRCTRCSTNGSSRRWA